MSDKYILVDEKTIQCEDLVEWAMWMKASNRIIGRDYIQVGMKEIRVSTVFLGLNHNWGDGPPILFETMIFEGKHDGYQVRYCTIEEAKAGHKRAIELVKGDQ